MKTTRKTGNRDFGKSSSKTQKNKSQSNSLHARRQSTYVTGGNENITMKRKRGYKQSDENNHLIKMSNREIKKERVEEKRKSLYKFLKTYEDSGAKLSISGHKYTAKRISEIMSVSENASYMPDFKMNDAGEVININYDKISNN